MSAARKTWTITLSAFGLVGAAIAAHQLAPSSAHGLRQGGAVAGTPAEPPAPLVAVASATCPQGKPVASVDPAGSSASQANPEARHAAQRGLDFLAHETETWTATHECYGCHVHAVTMEAMTVGMHHQYNVLMAPIVADMKQANGGAHNELGFAYEKSQLLAPSKAFAGAALARYDQWIDGAFRDDLLKVAGELITYQQEDGSIKLDWVNPPVGAGTIQGTYQAAQTWRQAYARSADDKWLLPLQRAEHYLNAQAKVEVTTPPASLQDLDYTIMGLASAGVSSSEDVMKSLGKQLVGRQNADGGWPLDIGGPSSPFATGQALYATRMIGFTDNDTVVSRGTRWLIDHQGTDGGWSHGGSGKAEAMWAVVGLVSVDVLTVAVTGLNDGGHLQDTQVFKINAEDNDPKGGGVSRVEVAIDDIKVKSECGASLSYTWDTRGLEKGMHTVDLIAENAHGQTAHRRLEVYAGSVYLTQVAAQSTADSTTLSVRDIADQSQKHRVEMAIVGADGAEVAVVGKTGEQGANTLKWDGRTKDGASAKSGKYVARLRYVDEGGKVVQSEDVPFVRDSEEAQHANYAEVGGELKLPNAEPAANAEVDLVDDKGVVVAHTRSTASGEYRFKNIEAGKYKVQAPKKGYIAPPVAVEAKPGVDSHAADMNLAAH